MGRKQGSPKKHLHNFSQKIVILRDKKSSTIKYVNTKKAKYKKKN